MATVSHLEAMLKEARKENSSLQVASCAVGAPRPRLTRPIPLQARLKAAEGYEPRVHALEESLRQQQMTNTELEGRVEELQDEKQKLKDELGEAKVRPESRTLRERGEYCVPVICIQAGSGTQPLSVAGHGSWHEFIRWRRAEGSGKGQAVGRERQSRT